MKTAQNLAFDKPASSRTIKKICALNDTLRRNLFSPNVPGEVILTAGVSALLDSDRFSLLDEVRCFEDFNEDNDPYGEHDFGRIDFKGERFFFKIDYYAPDMRHGSKTPAGPKRTRRVLTIMRADEY